MMHTLEKNFDVARIIIILKLQQEESKVSKKRFYATYKNLNKKHLKQLGTRDFKWAKGATSSLEAKRTKITTEHET